MVGEPEAIPVAPVVVQAAAEEVKGRPVVVPQQQEMDVAIQILATLPQPHQGITTIHPTMLAANMSNGVKSHTFAGDHYSALGPTS